jgi:hypothetical protein
MTGTVRIIPFVCGIIADMVRLLTGVAAWLAGTALAVGLAWFGAGLVVRSTGMTPSAPVIIAGPLPSAPAGPASPPASHGHAAGPRAAGPRAAAGRPSPSPSPSASASAGATAPADGTLRGYTLTGGHVTLLLTRNSAKLVSAVPADGYSVQTWSGAGWLRVDFSSGPQVSSLIASWNGHAPSVTVTN